MTTQKEETIFWGQDPNILFHQKFLLEFFPIENMSFNEKLNALSRSIIILTFLLFIFTRSIRIIFVCTFTLISIYILHQSHVNEGFSEMEQIEYNQQIVDTNKNSPASDLIKQNNLPVTNNIFQLPSSTNPFSNILVNDYSDNPKKKPAPPNDNPIVRTDILNSTKKLIQEINHGQPDIADELFQDLNDQLNFEQSMRSFNSTPGTTIPADQGAFADFCYGSMVSCKEGNLFACARNLTNHQNI
jgi:hypothetical protein